MSEFHIFKCKGNQGPLSHYALCKWCTHKSSKSKYSRKWAKNNRLKSRNIT